MRIHPAIQAAFTEQRPIYEKLQERVAADLRPLAAKNRWHYEDRIKNINSLTLKVETGRIKDLSRIEDFFACTIVVKNSSEIEMALAQVSDKYRIRYRRPLSSTTTKKQPSTFLFDDLRLYCTLKADPALPRSPQTEKLFEIQIKTFLLHAWSIATHDLTYKTDKISWSKERIAYQLRAMLEHAELSLMEADRLAQSPVIALESAESTQMQRVMGIMKNYWPPETLPEDLKRGAENILSVINSTKVSIERLEELVTSEKEVNGEMPLSETPYGVCLRLLVNHEAHAVQAFLASGTGELRLVFDGNREWPDWVPTENSKAAVVIRS